VKGINLEARLGIPGVFDFQAGYTIQSSRYTEPEDWSPELAPQRTMFRAPDQYGYFTADVRLTRNFHTSVFGNLTGPMLVQHTTPEGDFENMTPRFFDAGLKLCYEFVLHGSTDIEINCGVKNVFNEFQRDLDWGATKDAGYIYGPALPRMYFVGIKIAM
jgi:outer membrane receptor for ferrienterochelin and colicins